MEAYDCLKRRGPPLGAGGPGVVPSSVNPSGCAWSGRGPVLFGKSLRVWAVRGGLNPTSTANPFECGPSGAG
ncbi:hypothetical protein GCM10010404_24060 [Nonomuraea africana]